MLGVRCRNAPLPLLPLPFRPRRPYGFQRPHFDSGGRLDRVPVHDARSSLALREGRLRILPFPLSSKTSEPRWGAFPPVRAFPWSRREPRGEGRRHPLAGVFRYPKKLRLLILRRPVPSAYLLLRFLHDLAAIWQVPSPPHALQGLFRQPG